MSRLSINPGVTDHFRGAMDAPITLVEYGDYQCPFSRRAHGEVARVRSSLGHALRFVFRHFPLTQVHPEAFPAAVAAEVAGSLGHFWDMHDLLFENQDALERDALIAYADTLGLNLSEFEAGLENRRFHDQVRRNFASGVRSQVNGTPTFFINGVRHDGAFSAEALLDAIRGGEGVWL